MSGSIASAALAFLFFNFHPARIFMGDAGSVPLGFLLGSIGLYGWQRSLWPLWFPLLVFSPFVVDATVTLSKRLLLGEKVWQAHRSHYYQRLVRMGFGHRNTALMEYCLMFIVGMSALFLLGQPLYAQALGLIFWALIYCLLALLIDRLWSIRSAN
jgi:UDP-N-acetylmuramyl pentapeptide phosphotransferase/UDP-N-acetylglucosamine-1-phosphate transferase